LDYGGVLHFSLEKLINFKGNRYELARASMEYAKKVRYLETDEYNRIGKKDALVALRAVLDDEIKYTLDEPELEDYLDMDEGFDNPGNIAVQKVINADK
jgi:DNA-directed RNA polymerase subunit K/omega